MAVFSFIKRSFYKRTKQQEHSLVYPKNVYFLKKYSRLSIFINAYTIFNTGFQSKNMKGLHWRGETLTALKNTHEKSLLIVNQLTKGLGHEIEFKFFDKGV